MGILRVATGEHLHGFCHSHGGLLQTVALRVFTQQGDDIFIMSRKAVNTLADENFGFNHFLFLLSGCQAYCTVIFPFRMVACWKPAFLSPWRMTLASS